MGGGSNPYDFFDDIVCINLDISVDRKKHAEHYFEKLGIPARFFTAVKHELGGLYGCFDSHIQIYIYKVCVFLFILSFKKPFFLKEGDQHDDPCRSNQIEHNFFFKSSSCERAIKRQKINAAFKEEKWRKATLDRCLKRFTIL